MGLLEKAAETPPEHSPPSNFQQWAESSGFAHCGVFSAQPRFMLLSRAHGIESETIMKSISTNDFWEGSAAGREWILSERGDECFAGFLQFLGNGEKEKAGCFAILKLRENPATIFFAYEANEFVRLPNEEQFWRALLPVLKSETDFSFRPGDEQKIAGLVGTQGAFVLTVSPKPVFETIFSGEEKLFFSENAEAKKILSNTMFEELLFEMKKQFPWPDFVCAENRSKIKIVSVLTGTKHEERAREKLFRAAKKILPASLATHIASETPAQTRDAKEIISHILRGTL